MFVIFNAYNVYSHRNEPTPFLTGQHDVDQGWISEVKNNGFTKIVPRFIVEHILLTNANVAQ
jgi:hypothetical protein